MIYEVTEEQTNQINNSFSYHSPKDNQPERYALLRGKARDLAFDILACTPPGREQCIAIATLEETIMWANKAIACGE